MGESDPASPLPTPVLFFDGECGLCHRSVAWFQRHDRHRVLRYAPLQGATYASLPEPGPTDLSSMVLVDERGLWIESDGVLAGLRAIGGGWRAAASIGRIIPRFLRDAAYRFVARRRIGWFGAADVCDLPGDRARFLP
ncbi:MAG: DCC1-like thiol-disulfide oxidoreductase family protein [Planctomycetota bacterium]|nr:DCC1-like thiol-disulfide oxidoreductase family protein [Planctomycetota bacterium]